MTWAAPWVTPPPADRMLVGMDVPVWVDDDCGVQDAEVLEGYSNSTSSAFTALLDDSEEAR